MPTVCQHLLLTGRRLSAGISWFLTQVCAICLQLLRTSQSWKSNLCLQLPASIRGLLYRNTSDWLSFIAWQGVNLFINCNFADNSILCEARELPVLKLWPCMGRPAPFSPMIFYLLGGRVLCSPGWCQISYVAKADLECLIFLPLLPQDYRVC